MVLPLVNVISRKMYEYESIKICSVKLLAKGMVGSISEASGYLLSFSVKINVLWRSVMAFCTIVVSLEWYSKNEMHISSFTVSLVA